jgi:hypothetical protein
MPSIGSDNHDRMCGLIEELIEKFEEHLDSESEPPVVKIEHLDMPPPTIHMGKLSVPPPVVNVEAAKVNVPAPIVNFEVAAAQVKVPAPIVNVTTAPPDVRSWTFTVKRDAEGRIQTIDANPK